MNVPPENARKTEFRRGLSFPIAMPTKIPIGDTNAKTVISPNVTPFEKPACPKADPKASAAADL